MANRSRLNKLVSYSVEEAEENEDTPLNSCKDRPRVSVTSIPPNIIIHDMNRKYSNDETSTNLADGSPRGCRQQSTAGGNIQRKLLAMRKGISLDVPDSRAYSSFYDPNNTGYYSPNSRTPTMQANPKMASCGRQQTWAGRQGRPPLTSQKSVSSASSGNGLGDHNPLYKVSSDLLRLTGPTKEFKNLLAKGRSFEMDEPGRRYPPAHHSCGDVTALILHAEENAKNSFKQGVRSVTISETKEGVTVDEEGQTLPGSADWAQRRSRLDRKYSRRVTTEEMMNSRNRINKRRWLFDVRSTISDLSVVFALLGIGLAVVHAELTANYFSSIHSQNSRWLLGLRCLVLVSTLVLLVFIIFYHATEMELAVLDSGAEDWRVAITRDRLLKLLLEIVVCSISPLPVTGTILWPYIDEYRYRSFTMIPVNFPFVFKTMMSDNPLRVMVLFTLVYWLCSAWMFTQCERYRESMNRTVNGSSISMAGDLEYLNSLWFIMVTFMSVGYGDIVPLTYCGRALGIATALVGAVVSSALIAVITMKLELSRSEKHVNIFMKDSKLSKQLKHTAASVLQQTWFIHRCKKELSMQKTGAESKVRAHQRAFLKSIARFRAVRWAQRNLADMNNELVDFAKIQESVNEGMQRLELSQQQLVGQVETLTAQIGDLHNHILLRFNLDNQQYTSSNRLRVQKMDSQSSDASSTRNYLAPILSVPTQEDTDGED